MNKFISTLFFLFLFIGIVYSHFNVVGKKHEFKPSTELRGLYSQQSGDGQSKGHHKAEIYFKTKVPSLNPDLSGVSSVDCSNGNKITLGLDDEDAIEKVNDWPDKVMLLISHKWKCFGKKTTQYFMTRNKSIDTSNKKVTFTIKRCKVTDWSDEFSIDLSWVKAKNRRRLNRKDLFPIIPIDISNKLSLDALFNKTTGKSSSPNFPLKQDGNISLLCANCFLKGETAISMKLAGSFGFSLDLTEATLTLDGNALMNADFSLNGTVENDVTFDKTLLSLPLPGNFDIPGIFSLGPSIDLDISANISTKITGTLSFGGAMSLPHFNANVTFTDPKNPQFLQSGLNPKTKLHEPKFGIDSASVNIAGSIKPQLAFGINIFNGFFEQKLGLEIVGTLNNDITFDDDKDKNSCSKKTKPRLKIDLSGDVGFFVDNNDFPIVKFPSLNLLDKCL